MSKTEIKLGDEVEDIVAKVRGIAHARIEYLDGSIHWVIMPPGHEMAVMAKEIYSPDAYCVKVGDGVYAKPKPQAGFHARNKKVD